ncbi:MAG TPA: class I SAM-dependent methyltransferase [Acetobacteraceae bacterium]|nr:class I SAM-dependent methyltransferase [Acetobacteraceae bacterium]
MTDHAGSPAWRAANRANWDERVAVHLRAPSYDLVDLRAGRGRLHPVEEAELGALGGRRVLHLQCHFGRDTLVLAQRGARVTGLDFSPAAVAAARELASELGLEACADFIEADVYDAPAAIGAPGGFDLVFVTWGALCWLPDVGRWAEIVAHFLKPGGQLYLADVHPAAMVFDERKPDAGVLPPPFAPYFLDRPLVVDDPRDYADPAARLSSARTYQFLHGLGTIVSSLASAGLRIDWLHEHRTVPWRMFDILVECGPDIYGWPGEPWLPLSFSLQATRPA